MTAVTFPLRWARSRDGSPSQVATAKVRRPRFPEQVIAGVGLLGLYIGTGLWLRMDVGFAIGDAIARSANAVYVVASRDPHLAAIGFYWPPLSSFVQLPLIPFLAPSGHADLAGPISTAVCMAVTCILLMRMAVSFGLTRKISTVVGLLFGLNPVIVFYAANGMSEASCFLFLTIGMWGFVRYRQSGRTTDLALMATGLALSAMARVEVLFVSVIVAIVATFEWRGIPRSLPRSFARAAVAALPPVYIFMLWMGVQWILLRDPLFFVHTAGQVGGHLDLRNNPAASGYLLPQAKDKLAVAGWLIEQIWFFGPTLFLGAIYVVVRPRRSRVAVGLLAAAATFEAIQVPYRLSGSAFNDPRYFTPLAVLGVVAAIWLLAELQTACTSTDHPRPTIVRWGATIIVLGSLVAGAIAGTVAEANPRRARVVREDAFFSRVLRRSQPYPYVQEWSSWRRIAGEIDHLLAAPGGPHKVICGGAACNPAIVFSTRASQFVVLSDRDYQSILSDPVDKFDLAITTGSSDPTASLLLTPNEWSVAATFTLSGLSSNQTVRIWMHHATTPTHQGTA